MIGTLESVKEEEFLSTGTLSPRNKNNNNKNNNKNNNNKNNNKNNNIDKNRNSNHENSEIIHRLKKDIHKMWPHKKLMEGSHHKAIGKHSNVVDTKRTCNSIPEHYAVNGVYQDSGGGGANLMATKSGSLSSLCSLEANLVHQANVANAWKQKFTFENRKADKLKMENELNMKQVQSQLLLIESKLLKNKNEVEAIVHHKDRIIHRQHQLICNLTLALIKKNGHEELKRILPGIKSNNKLLTKLEQAENDKEENIDILNREELIDNNKNYKMISTTKSEFESLNDSDSAIIMEDTYDSLSTISTDEKEVKIMRSVSDALEIISRGVSPSPTSKPLYWNNNNADSNGNSVYCELNSNSRTYQPIIHNNKDYHERNSNVSTINPREKDIKKRYSSKIVSLFPNCSCEEVNESPTLNITTSTLKRKTVSTNSSTSNNDKSSTSNSDNESSSALNNNNKDSIMANSLLRLDQICSSTQSNFSLFNGVDPSPNNFNDFVGDNTKDNFDNLTIKPDNFYDNSHWKCDNDSLKNIIDNSFDFAYSRNYSVNACDNFMDNSFRDSSSQDNSSSSTPVPSPSQSPPLILDKMAALRVKNVNKYDFDSDATLSDGQNEELETSFLKSSIPCNNLILRSQNSNSLASVSQNCSTLLPTSQNCSNLPSKSQNCDNFSPDSQNCSILTTTYQSSGILSPSSLNSNSLHSNFQCSISSNSQNSSLPSTSQSFNIFPSISEDSSSLPATFQNSIYSRNSQICSNLLPTSQNCSSLPASSNILPSTSTSKSSSLPYKFSDNIISSEANLVAEKLLNNSHVPQIASISNQNNATQSKKNPSQSQPTLTNNLKESSTQQVPTKNSSLLTTNDRLNHLKSSTRKKSMKGDVFQTTYNRVMSNHRSVTKPKDVKYKRINKAKSRSLEELRGKLRYYESNKNITVVDAKLQTSDA